VATDASFIAFSRVDYGPVVIEFLFKVLSLFFLFYFDKTKKQRYLLLLILSLGLGLFNKANFIWFINGLFIGVLVFYRDIFLSSNKRLPNKNGLILVVFYTVFLLYAIFVLKKSSNEYSLVAFSLSKELLQNNIVVVLNNFIQLLNGSALFKLIFGIFPHPYTLIYSVGLLLFNLAGIGYFIRCKSKISINITRFYFFILLTFATMFAQLILTSNAISPWHTYSLYPFLTVMTAIFLYQLQKTSLTKVKVSYIIFGSVIFYNLFTYSKYILYYGKPVKDLEWSDKFYQLIKFTDPYPGLVLVTDTILQTNLLALSKNYNKYTPIEWMVKTADYESYKSNLQGYFKKEPVILVIVPHIDLTTFKEVRPLFFQFVKDYRISLVKIKEFFEGEKVVYTVYQVS
jgi:hypothetical protein